jgi:hypothetical protein
MRVCRLPHQRRANGRRMERHSLTTDDSARRFLRRPHARRRHVPPASHGGGELAGGTLTHTVGILAVGAVQVCSFSVTVNPTPFGGIALTDSFTCDSGAWTGAGTGDAGPAGTWSVSEFGSLTAQTTRPASDQTYTLNGPVPISSNTVLSFRHTFGFEPGFDGGVVEVSTDGDATWVDIDTDFTNNGYSGTLDSTTGNPLAGQPACRATHVHRHTRLPDIRCRPGPICRCNRTDPVPSRF